MARKTKPHKGLLKRVKVTGGGRVVRKKANRGHLMTSKPAKRRRRLRRTDTVAPCDEKRMKRMLGLK